MLNAKTKFYHDCHTPDLELLAKAHVVGFLFLFSGSRVKTKHEFGLCSLDMKGIYPEDSGTITCRAQNESGRAETTGKLVCKGEDFNTNSIFHVKEAV